MRISSKIKKLLVLSVENAILHTGKCPPWMRTKPLQHRISLVVPCYNVSAYIDDFLKSVASQTTGTENLEVILVDDGSTDETPRLAREWAAKNPKWIKYHRQDNRGLCGARNAGLSLATGDWVSFPDPDDFLHHRYLETVDGFLTRTKHTGITLVCCNFVRYYEKTRKKRNDHGLRFRFAGGERIVPSVEMGNMMQLAVNSAFLRREQLEAFSLRFNPLIVPGFEDAEVVNRYILHQPNTFVGFLPQAIYYYRKRADESSLQDTARTKKEFYLNQPRYGWLSILKAARETRGSVPHFIQRTVLYDTIGRFRNHIKRPQSLGLLSPDERQQYKDTVAEALASIDPRLVAETELPGLYEDLRVGILNLYFNQRRDVTNAYITDYDDNKNLMRISVYGASASEELVVRNNGTEVEQLFKKTIHNSFLGETFFYEIAFWVPVAPGHFTITSSTGPIRFRLNGKSFNGGISRDEIIARLGSRVKPTPRSTKYDGGWLLMDRADKADDNAEHFYRYLLNRRDGGRYYFVLYRNSPDWDRLKKEGFKLIEFGSRQHLKAIKRAKYLISSHGDAFIRKPFKASRLRGSSYKFLFIQHGVTKDNQSEWFNAMSPALLAAATPDEYNSIVGPTSDYHLSAKEVHLTGFPRHDALLQQDAARKMIFIMPTWRGSFGGQLIRPGLRDVKAGFELSEYVKRWSSLLNSPELYEVANEEGLSIVFCPHPNLAKQLEAFQVPAYVETVPVDRIPSLQPFFAQMAVMVTDYSSVAFDAAFLNKPVVYYQFDRESFFADHIYRQGYFDYDKDGFGPIARSETEAIGGVAKAVTSREEPVYEQRRLSTFRYRDGKASERLFEAIKSLERPLCFANDDAPIEAQSHLSSLEAETT